MEAGLSDWCSFCLAELGDDDLFGGLDGVGADVEDEDEDADDDGSECDFFHEGCDYLLRLRKGSRPFVDSSMMMVWPRRGRISDMVSR